MEFRDTNIVQFFSEMTEQHGFRKEAKPNRRLRLMVLILGSKNVAEKVH